MSRTRRPAEKSCSEKLRGIFYQLYLKENSKKEFDIYYKEKMSLLLVHYQSLLDKK